MLYGKIRERKFLKSFLLITMKSFKVIVKKQSREEQKASIFFWFVFVAATIIVAVVMFLYYQNTVRVIDAQASSGEIINHNVLR